jgi:hypothetical protein
LHVLQGAAGEHHEHHHVHDHEHDLPSVCSTPCGEDQLELSLPHLEVTRLTATVRLAAPYMPSTIPIRWTRTESAAVSATARHRWKPSIDAPPRSLQGGVAALLVSSRALLI